jgi:hypothetical protein
MHNAATKKKERPARMRESLFEVDVLKGVFGAQSEYDW